MSQPDAPLFSIITPVFNASATLDETLASVRAQTRTDWEHLLIDDASSDNSRALLEAAAARDPRLRVIALSRRSGAARARNAGIRAARGRYIAFLDADDLWHPDKLARQKTVLETGAGLVFSSYRRIDASGRELGQVRAPALLDFDHALRGNAIGCLTAVYDTAIYGKTYMPDIPRRQDYGLWLDLLRRGGAAVGIEDSLADYRVRPNSLSSNKVRAALGTWQVLRDSGELGRISAAWHFGQYVAHALRKRL
ncbi:MAG: glycosyltransferase family 2 protein [Maritimibacter sp.]|nr:glycosyltransferase family 2 protein [Maritimibacter sp.]